MSTIIDNGDAGYSTTGTWTDFGKGYNNDLQYRNSSTVGSNTATWNFGAISAGQYKVEVHWLTNSNRVTDAPYTIYHRGVVSTPTVSSPIVSVNDNVDEDGNTNADTTTVDVDQRPYADGSSAPNGENSGFCDIGTYTADGSTDFKVVLTDTGSSGDIIADAVRITYIGPVIATTKYLEQYRRKQYRRTRIPGLIHRVWEDE